jgi:Ca2+-binding EF-hand superfamily protein
MTDSTSINMKPGAAILMALALITTTFAGVSYADPTTGNGSMNTMASMDYDELDMIVDFDANGTDYTALTAEIHVYDGDGFSAWFGPEDMMEESDNTSWNTHWADISLTLFFEGSVDASPMADEGTWYSVDAYVNDSYDGSTVGHAFTEICMANGSVCEMPTLDTEAEDTFNEVDVDGDGAINGTELINHENLMRSQNNESPMNTSEEIILLDAMADYDTGFTSADGNDTEDANDGMLEFYEFMDFYYDYIMGDYESVGAMLDETGVLTVMIHNGDGNIAYVQIVIMDMYQNELINETHFPADSSDPTNGFDDWTSPDCCADSGMYTILVYVYDENDSMIGMEFLTVGEMPTQEEMMFQMFDLDGNGTISIDEYIAVMEDGSNETVDEQTKSMITNLFTGEDVDGDQELNMDEFSSFVEAMNNMGEGGEGEYSEMELMMTMLDTDGDGNISLTEVLVMADDSEIVTFYTNVFNHNDFNGNGMLNLSELTFFMAHMDDLDPSYCYEVKAGDNVMEDGELYELGESSDEDMKMDLVAGETASFDGEFCPEDQPLPSGEFMVFYADLNGDGKISLTEAISLLNSFSTDDSGEPLSDVEEEWVSIAFKMNDRDGDELLDDDEFENFYYQIQSLQDDDEDHDNGGDANMVCYDRENLVVVGGYTDATSCEAAGYTWADMSQSSGGDDQNNTDTEDEGDEIDFMNINVMFEQWHDDSMELVIIELAVIDNAEDIARLSMMADSMYGNNDTVLDESEVDMLMALYAMNLDIDDISKGMTLDGQNGTAVDFWVEIDGLLEGDDVVFIRVGTVIEFPTTAYDNSTAHTFVVMDVEDDQSNETMNDSMEDSENCQDYTIWIHNSETWNVDSATGFAFEETNNAWHTDECALDDQESLIFTLSKVENATLPTEEEDDWTWEDEEMNMFPVCDWYYAVTFANGSMMEDQWMQDAPESGDYMIMLMDNASYDIYVKCWDPEQGKMVVDITSPLGNSSNTSLGYAMGYISFKLPAGTGGNVTFDVTWTDGYYTESGTLTVYATGDGSIDLSDIEVAESEGLLPGFTAAMGVLAMLGAAMIAGRRNKA